MFLNLPPVGTQPHQVGQFPLGEARIDAHVHVMAGDVVDERIDQSAMEMGEPGAQRLAEEYHLEAIAELPEAAQGFPFEMMEEEIRDEDAAVDGDGGFENIALPPIDPRLQMGRPWRQIQCRDFGIWKGGGELAGEDAIPRTDLRDAPGGGLRETPRGPEQPAVISHQGIDHPQIPAAADGPGIVRGEMIENFRNDDTDSGHTAVWCTNRGWGRP